MDEEKSLIADIKIDPDSVCVTKGEYRYLLKADIAIHAIADIANNYDKYDSPELVKRILKTFGYINKEADDE